MTTRRRNLLFLLAVFALAAAGFVVAERSDTARARGAIDAVPAESFLVVTLRADALRESPLARPLFENLTRAASLGAETCGVDLLLRVREIALAFPEGEGEFALAVDGAFERDALVACAKKVIAARGGEARVSRHGHFTVLETSDATREVPKIALRDGGPLLLGRGAWLDTMMATADGGHPSVLTNPAHVALRDTLAGTTRRTVVATAVLPAALRERIKREMEGESGASGPVVAGILGVETAGLAVSTGGAGGESEAWLALRCEAADGCAAVKQLVEWRRQVWSRDMGMRLIGLGPLVDSITVEGHGTELSVRAHAPEADLAALLTRLSAAFAPDTASSSPPAARTPAPPPAPPDEVLRAGRAVANPTPRDPPLDLRK